MASEEERRISEQLSLKTTAESMKRMADAGAWRDLAIPRLILIVPILKPDGKALDYCLGLHSDGSVWKCVSPGEVPQIWVLVFTNPPLVTTPKP
jgi:hypothetical protein